MKILWRLLLIMGWVCLWVALPLVGAQDPQTRTIGITNKNQVVVRSEPYFLASTDTGLRLQQGMEVEILGEPVKGDYVDGNPLWYPVRIMQATGEVMEAFIHASVLRIEIIEIKPVVVEAPPAPPSNPASSNSESNASNSESMAADPVNNAVAAPALTCADCHGAGH